MLFGYECDAVDPMASVHIIVSSLILCLNIFHSVLRRVFFIIFFFNKILCAVHVVNNYISFFVVKQML
jgi:hypothetical protein